MNAKRGRPPLSELGPARARFEVRCRPEMRALARFLASLARDRNFARFWARIILQEARGAHRGISRVIVKLSPLQRRRLAHLIEAVGE